MFFSFIKKYFLLIVILFCGMFLFANEGIDIYVSKIIVESEKDEYKGFDISPIVRQSLLSTSNKNFTFRGFSEIVSSESIVMKEKIRNDNMAYEVCSILGIKYLIYGSIYIENDKMVAEIKLFSNSENKTILTINIEKKNETNLSRFVEEMILEVDNKINKDFKFSNTEILVTLKSDDYKPQVKEKSNTISKDKKENNKKIYPSNHIGIYTSLGYSIPVASWWDVLTGVINFDIGVKIVRIKPFYDNKKVSLNLRPGILFDYTLYLNKQSLAESYFNSFIFKAPLDFNVNLFNRVEMFVGGGPLVQMDLFTQKYFDNYINYFSVSFGLFTSIGVEYFLDKKQLVSIGLNNNFDFIFYDHFFINYKFQFYTMIKFKEKR
ncbi:MAG: hypothetical protein A2Y34_16035 [Spirochaetes bacterium GWC1_27_15]|nr:MAG: hypothetical protein A2Z98_03780 [Spirochaetes bacterium GWB1_27_13]OHD27147.1 MAG: hypothetical protein A2Y34_16035 [Spirochaetes bacterium GWC1_27_15]